MGVEMKRQHLAILVVLLLAAASAMAAHAVCSGSGTITEPCLTVYKVVDGDIEKLVHVRGEVSVHRDIFGNLIIRPRENVTVTFYGSKIKEMRLNDDDFIVLYSDGYQGFVVERYVVTAWYITIDDLAGEKR
ncbi:MAG TPA: hypothetical protein ENF26_00990 [Methanomicrobia archaeon]|nr:hypothetical protein [Methanomicrobia archaeon]HEX58707.1 hypothetical protein [Methanomicrobia archaeon]